MTAKNPIARWRTEIVDGYTFYRILAQTSVSARPRPPVLLLNGCALAAGSWTPVINGLGGHDIFAIDRPGFADTAWSGGLPDLVSEVAIAVRIITGMSERSPHESERPPGVPRPPAAIVVAHSMASFRAEALARLRPELVAGIVLVDPSIEAYSDRGITSRFFSATLLNFLSSFLSPTEIREFGASVSHQGLLRQISSGRDLDRDVFKDPYADPETLKSAFAEWLSYRGQGADLTTLRASTVPVRTPTSALFASVHPNRRRLSVLDANFIELTLTKVEGSGHLIMIDRPDEIIRAVGEHAV